MQIQIPASTISQEQKPTLSWILALTELAFIIKKSSWFKLGNLYNTKGIVCDANVN